jgi:hypothetical protein
MSTQGGNLNTAGQVKVQSGPAAALGDNLQEVLDEVVERTSDLQTEVAAVTPAGVTLPDLFAALFDSNVLLPPLNVFDDFDPITDTEITLSLDSASAADVAWDIQAQISTDEETWTDGPAAEEDGSGDPITVLFDELDPETEYFFRWRSVAQGNTAVFSAWSDTESESTIATP